MVDEINAPFHPRSFKKLFDVIPRAFVFAWPMTLSPPLTAPFVEPEIATKKASH